MKITKMVVSDFQGLIGLHEYDMDQVKVLIGKNGTGKTSFLNAVRYGLTGQEPAGQMISYGKPMCQVVLEMESGTIFSRQRTASGQKCYVNRKPVSVAEFNKQISRYVDIGAMKIVSSSEAVAAMRPEIFEELLLTYGEEADKEEIISFVSNPSDEKKDILSKALPDGKVNVRSLAAVYTEFYENRRKLKKNLIDKDAEMKYLKNLGEIVPPMETMEELQKNLQEAMKKQEKVSVYNTMLAAYNRAVQDKDKQAKQIETIKATIASIVMPEGYAPEKKEVAEETLREANESMNLARQQYAAFVSTIQTMDKAITTLDQPICPLSAKLKCTTDKSSIKDELVRTKQEAETGLKAAETQISKAEKKIVYCQDFLKKLNDGKMLEERKQMLQQQLNQLESSSVNIPEKPEALDVRAVANEVAAARNAIDSFTRYMRYAEVKKTFMEEKRQYIMYDEMVQSFSDKGEVKEKLMAKYIIDFENKCNEIAYKLDSGKMRIRLMQNNGVVVLTDISGDGQYLDFKSLSGGEQAKVVYVIMSLLSKESGFKILMLDELSVLDAEGMDTLLSTIRDHKNEFDHIFICMVDHDDSIDLVSKYFADTDVSVS